MSQPYAFCAYADEELGGEEVGRAEGGGGPRAGRTGPMPPAGLILDALERLRPDVLRRARRMGLPADEALGECQLAVVRAARGFDAGRGCLFRTLASRTAMNTLVDMARARGRRVAAGFEGPDCARPEDLRLEAPAGGDAWGRMFADAEAELGGDELALLRLFALHDVKGQEARRALAVSQRRYLRLWNAVRAWLSARAGAPRA